MHVLLFIVVGIAASSTVQTLSLPPVQLLAEWPHPAPAVASFVTASPDYPADGFPGNENGTSLLLATFAFGAGDGVWGMRNLTGALAAGSQSQLTFVPMDTTVPWPNYAAFAPTPLGPSGWGEGRSVVLEAGGFFPNPAKATGTIVINDVTNILKPVPATISHPKTNYFYHQAQLVDINGDGRLDVLAARALNPSDPFKTPIGELVWLEQPVMAPGAAFNSTWVERVLISPHGPDVGFLAHDFDGDGSLEILATEYFDSKSLTLYWCASPWTICQPNDVSSRVLLGGVGAFFSLSLADLNGDNKLDVLVTTNANNGSGGVYGVEIPDTGINTSAWKVHSLGPRGYAPRNKFLPGQGGPGKAIAFQVNEHALQPKPSVMLSGDDNGTVFLLTPTSADPTAWDYSVRALYTSSKGTVGTPTVGDTNGDGWAEFVVPSYAENSVLLFTFAPNTTTL